MKRQRHWLAAAALLGSLLEVGPTAASPLVDPFLERFRVGHYQDPASVALQGGWPRDLFMPCRIDALWQAAAESLLAAWSGQAPAQAPALLVAIAGGQAGSEGWAREQRARLRYLGEPARADSSRAWRGGWLSKEILQLNTLYYYEIGVYDTATARAELLLERAQSLDLAPEERFVWSLRLRRLRALAAPAAPDSVPWPEMLELGRGDGASAWAIWVARQRWQGQPLLPPGSGSTSLARFLVRLPKTWLDEACLEGAGFAADEAIGVGAASLADAQAHAAFYRRHPRPPADGGFLTVWLRGLLRGGRTYAARAESLLAAQPLPPAQAARLWRRAAEERLLAGDWERALADLRRAFATASPAAQAVERDATADWARQALVLAAVRDRRAEAARIFALVDSSLSPAERADWAQRCGRLRERLAGEQPAPIVKDGQDLRQDAQTVVRAGAALPIGVTPGEWAWPARGKAWVAWRAWGRALAAGRVDSTTDPATAMYAAALAREPAAPAADPGEDLAPPALGQYLARSPFRETALTWLLAQAIANAAGAQATFAAARPPLHADRWPAWPERHALLGLALAADDANATLVLASGLPAGGLSLQARLPLLYPVPGGAALRRQLGETGLDPALLLAVARNESLFDPAARSAAGALGWLQIMPFHYPERGAPSGRPIWRRPEWSLATGVQLLKQAGIAFDGDSYRVLAGYNAGLGAVRRWLRQLGGPVAPDLFLIWIGYAETRAYVEKVLIDREIYGWILAGQASGAS